MKNLSLLSSMFFWATIMVLPQQGLLLVQADSYMYGVLMANIPHGSCTSNDYDAIQATMVASELCAGAMMNITFGDPPLQVFDGAEPTSTAAPTTAAPTLASPSSTPSLRGSAAPSASPVGDEDIFTRGRDLAATAEVVAVADPDHRNLQVNFCTSCCSQPYLCIPFPYRCNCGRRLLDGEDDNNDFEVEQEQEDFDEQEEQEERLAIQQKQEQLAEKQQQQRRMEQSLEEQAKAHWQQCWVDRQQQLAFSVTTYCRRALRVATTDTIAHIESL